MSVNDGGLDVFVGLSNGSQKVLIAILKEAKKHHTGCAVHFSQHELSERHGIHYDTVRRAYKELREADIIVPAYKVRRKLYLNPELFYFGYPKFVEMSKREYDEERAKYPEQESMKKDWSKAEAAFLIKTDEGADSNGEE